MCINKCVYILEAEENKVALTLEEITDSVEAMLCLSSGNLTKFYLPINGPSAAFYSNQFGTKMNQTDYQFMHK